MIDFPNSPSVGQTFTSGNSTWTWDGTKWVAAGAAGASSIYLPLTGGTLSGPLTEQSSLTVQGATTLASASATSLIIPGGAMSPSGRLTLTSGVPVMTAAVTASPNVYFTPYKGNMVPLWNGTQFVWTPFTELTNVLSASSVNNAGPAAVAVSTVYDLYVWNNAGTLRLTRSPAWSAGGGSNQARGTGAGSAGQAKVNGIIVNAQAITNGPAAGYGTCVGTIYTDSSGTTVSWALGGSALGGVVATLDVWNMYNRVPVRTSSTDNGAAYAYGPAGWRVARGGAGLMLIVWVAGQAEDGFSITYEGAVQVAATVGSFGMIGPSLDTSAAPVFFNYMQTPSAMALTMATSTSINSAPVLGVHYSYGMESGDGATVSNFNQASNNSLLGSFMM